MIFREGAGIFAGDGSVFALSWEGIVRWDASDGSVAGALTLGFDAGAWSGLWDVRDGRALVANLDGASASVVDLATGEVIAALAAMDGDELLRCGAVALGDEHVALGLGDGSIRTYGLDGGELHRVEAQGLSYGDGASPGAHTPSLGYSPAGDLAIWAGQASAPLQLWAPDGSSLRGTVEGGPDVAYHARFAADAPRCTVLSLVDERMALHVVDLETRETLGEHPIAGVATEAALSPDGGLLATSGRDSHGGSVSGDIHLTGTGNGEARVLDSGFRGGPKLAFSEDGDRLYAFNAWTGVTALDVDGGGEPVPFDLPE